MTRVRRYLAAVGAMVAVVLLPSTAWGATLGSDNFASAGVVTIATSGGTYTSDPTPNSSLTMESGEPYPTGAGSSGKSAWWVVEFASAGTATFTTAGTTTTGSNTDTEMALYTGSTLATLTKVASNADGCAGARACITGQAVTAQKYYVQVSSYSGIVGMSYVLGVTGPATVASSPSPSPTPTATVTATPTYPPAPGVVTGVYVDPSTGALKVDENTGVALGVACFLGAVCAGLITTWLVMP